MSIWADSFLCSALDNLAIQWVHEGSPLSAHGSTWSQQIRSICNLLHTYKIWQLFLSVFTNCYKNQVFRTVFRPASCGLCSPLSNWLTHQSTCDISAFTIITKTILTMRTCDIYIYLLWLLFKQNDFQQKFPEFCCFVRVWNLAWCHKGRTQIEGLRAGCCGEYLDLRRMK
jgi:hypothetical protein